jgi:hypothetical protein
MLLMQMSQKSRQLLLRVQALEDEQLRCLRCLHSSLRLSFAFANPRRRLRCIATRLRSSLSSRLSIPLALSLPVVKPSTFAHKLSNVELWLAGCMPRQRLHVQNLRVVLSEDIERPSIYA